MKNRTSRKGGSNNSSCSSSSSSSSKKSAADRKLEQTLLDQDFAERLSATDRINRFRRTRNQREVIPSAPPAVDVPVAGTVGTETIGLIYEDENVDPNYEPEGAAEGECTYAELSKDDLARARGDFQEWERNVKKGLPQQPPKQAPQKPPKKAKKPATKAPDDDATKATDHQAHTNEAGGEQTETVYATIIGVLKQ